MALSPPPVAPSARLAPLEQSFWVFGYGSLMWNPGFEYVESRMATASGFARRFCLRSVCYRGTPADPGLVLGLDADHGAACVGVAFRVSAAHAAEAHAYLQERELISDAYDEVVCEVAFECGALTQAVTYQVRRDHPQYAGALPIETQAEVIARAVGPRGPNAEYLFNTCAQLTELGVRDPELEALSVLVRGRR